MINTILESVIFFRDNCQCQKCKKLLNKNNAVISYRTQIEKIKYHSYNMIITCKDQNCIDYFKLDQRKTELLISIINSNLNLDIKNINYLLGV